DRLLGETYWLWSREYTMVVRHDSLGIVLETLLSRREPCSKDAKQSLCIAELSFDDFIAALSVRGYQPEEKNMRLLLSDPDHFWKSTVKKLADRSAVIELSRTDSGSSLKDTVLFGGGAGELWTRRSLAKSNPPRLVIDPSSLPSEPLPYARSWTIATAHLIPYRTAVDGSPGSITLGLPGSSASCCSPAACRLSRLSNRCTLRVREAGFPAQLVRSRPCTSQASRWVPARVSRFTGPPAREPIWAWKRSSPFCRTDFRSAWACAQLPARIFFATVSCSWASAT